MLESLEIINKNINEINIHKNDTIPADYTILMNIVELEIIKEDLEALQIFFKYITLKKVDNFKFFDLNLCNCRDMLKEFNKVNKWNEKQNNLLMEKLK